ncbi:recombinase family protein [Vibrio coralliilyticus]|uniref:recombinase family protein n=1 Tax=Vibrio coralliilyticus TaxID=190893 RepID=UPI002FD697CE
MKLAYSYVRFSSPEQAKGDSYRRQIELARKFCLNNGLELSATTIKDLGVSAFRGSNFREGAFGAFIEAIKSGEISKGSYLLIESMDRLSRERLSVAHDRFKELLRLGINVVTLQDNKLYNEASLDKMEDMMLMMVIMNRAHEESQIKSQRLQAAQAEKRKQAREHKTPTGYRPPDWMQKGTNGYQLIPDRVAIVKRIFQLTIDGFGAIAIAKLLNSEGLKPWGRSKTGWQTTYIKKVLRSRTVLGEYQPHKMVERKRVPDGEPIPDFYPPIIDPITFKKADIAIRSRDRRPVSQRKLEVNNLFTGLVSCKKCGNTMHYVNKGSGSKGGQYLVCSLARTGATKNGVKCSYSSMRYPIVESAILTTVAAISLNLEPINNAPKIEALKDELALAESRRSDLEAKTKRWLVKLDDNFDDDAMWQHYQVLKEKLGNAIAQCKAISDALDELEMEGSEKNALKRLSANLKRLKVEAIDRGNVELRTKINNELKKLLKGIEFDAHEKTIFINIDSQKVIELRFDNKQKGYKVKPSWDKRELPPSVFGVKFAAHSFSSRYESPNH